MTSPRLNVATIVVTYGHRWRYLKQVLAELCRHDSSVHDVVIVDNASAGLHLPEIGSDTSLRFHIVRLPDNMGSAKGFKVGIEAAGTQTDAELYWLLDDDNLPEPHCLERLLSSYDTLGARPSNVLLALRPDRREYVEASRGERVLRIQPNSFMGLHLNKIASRVGLHRPFERPKEDLIPVGHAPYGGLLFHRTWVDRIGLPDEEYYLYADDFEFTSRITRNGGTILLCPAARIQDLETSWHLTQRPRFHWMAPDLDSTRVYYSMRNRVHLERTRFVSSNAMYAVNAATFILLRLWCGAIYHIVRSGRLGKVFSRTRLLMRAICDGWIGRLGRVVLNRP